MSNSSNFDFVIDRIHTLLRLYYNKASWPKVYPLLVDSADQFINEFDRNQSYLIAHLTTYIKHRGYTTNLIINQWIIINVIAKQHGLNKHAISSLLQNAIANVLVCSNELNNLAKQTPLTAQQKKLYSQRFTLALNLLKKHLPKLPLLQTDLYARAKKQTLISEHSIIINLSFTIAKQITISQKVRPKMLIDVISEIYVRSQNLKEKKFLFELARLFKKPLPGDLIKVENDNCMVIGTNNKNQCVYYNFSNKQFDETARYQQVKANKMRILESESDLHIFWQNAPELETIIKAPDVQTYFTSKALISLKKAANFSQGRLLKEISANNYAPTLVFDIASRFSRQPIKDLRHAVALVGVEQLPELLENEQLLQRLKTLGIVNFDQVLHKLAMLIKFIESFKRTHKNFLSQNIINHALKYLAFHFKTHPHGVILPNNRLHHKLRVTHLSDLMNFYCYAPTKIPSVLASNPFYKITQEDLKITALTDTEKWCFLITCICNMVYLGIHFAQLSQLTQQQLLQVKTDLDLNDLDNYLTFFIQLGPSNQLS